MYNNCAERAADVSEIKKRSANATTWLNQKLEQEKQVDRDIKNCTIVGSVYGEQFSDPHPLPPNLSFVIQPRLLIFRLSVAPPFTKTALLFGTGEYDWLSTHSPFDVTDDRLRSISFRITVPDNNRLINCDNTEVIG